MENQKAGETHEDAVLRDHIEDVLASLTPREEKVVHVPCFVCGVGTSAELMQADGVHPNEKAQAAILDAVWPHIRPQLRCPAKQR